MVLIFKNKGDVQRCGDYRGIKLLKFYNSKGIASGKTQTEGKKIEE